MGYYNLNEVRQAAIEAAKASLIGTVVMNPVNVMKPWNLLHPIGQTAKYHFTTTMRDCMAFVDDFGNLVPIEITKCLFFNNDVNFIRRMNNSH